jgi:hypothetical protein
MMIKTLFLASTLALACAAPHATTTRDGTPPANKPELANAAVILRRAFGNSEPLAQGTSMPAVLLDEARLETLFRAMMVHNSGQ